MIRSLVVVLLAVMLGSRVHAETIAYPDEGATAFTVAVPDGWSSEVDDDGALVVESPDGSAWLVAWLGDEETSVEDLAQQVDEELSATFSDVSLGEAQAGDLNGRAALFMQGTGVEPRSRDTVQLGVMLFDVSADVAAVAYTVTYDDTSKHRVNQLDAVVSSIRSAAGDEEAAGEEGDPGDGDAAWENLQAGAWEPVMELGGALYPSLIVATATLAVDAEDDDPTTLGDPMGTFGVAVRSPKAGAKATVEISSTKVIKPSVWTGILPVSNEVYGIFPTLKFDYDTLLAVKQTHPEDVTFKVSIDGQPATEVTKRVQVRPVNDCVFGFLDYDGQPVDVTWMFAAYVNENSPFIDEILGEALDAGHASFAGYQGDADAVMAEMEAVWNALQDRGFRYSNITTTSGGETDVFSQHVRLLSESAKTSQANCVDGSVLLASIFRKLGLDVFLVLVPGHMFLGVNLDAAGEQSICIETTMMGTATFAEAVEAGNRQFEEGANAFETDPTGQHAVISIAEARAMGIMPLRDAGP